jgi:hypothetical protein
MEHLYQSPGTNRRIISGWDLGLLPEFMHEAIPDSFAPMPGTVGLRGQHCDLQSTSPDLSVHWGTSSSPSGESLKESSPITLQIRGNYSENARRWFINGRDVVAESIKAYKEWAKSIPPGTICPPGLYNWARITRQSYEEITEHLKSLPAPEEEEEEEEEDDDDDE